MTNPMTEKQLAKIEAGIDNLDHTGDDVQWLINEVRRQRAVLDQVDTSTKRIEAGVARAVAGSEQVAAELDKARVIALDLCDVVDTQAACIEQDDIVPEHALHLRSIAALYRPQIGAPSNPRPRMSTMATSAPTHHGDVRFYIRLASDIGLASVHATLPHLVYELTETGPRFICACGDQGQAQRVVDALSVHFTQLLLTQWHERM